jgi:hypothetical protein
MARLFGRPMAQGLQGLRFRTEQDRAEMGVSRPVAAEVREVPQECRMKLYGTRLKGYTAKGGKVEKIKGYGLDASAKIRQKKSKKVKPVKRTP